MGTPPFPPLGGGLRNTQTTSLGLRKNFGPRHENLPWKWLNSSKISKFFRLRRPSAPQAIYYTSILLFFSCLVVFIQLLMHQRVTQKFRLLELLLLLHIKKSIHKFHTQNFLRIRSISSVKFPIKGIRIRKCVSWFYVSWPRCLDSIAFLTIIFLKFGVWVPPGWITFFSLSCGLGGGGNCSSPERIMKRKKWPPKCNKWSKFKIF